MSGTDWSVNRANHLNFLEGAQETDHGSDEGSGEGPRRWRWEPGVHLQCAGKPTTVSKEGLAPKGPRLPGLTVILTVPAFSERMCCPPKLPAFLPASLFTVCLMKRGSPTIFNQGIIKWHLDRFLSKWVSNLSQVSLLNPGCGGFPP